MTGHAPWLSSLCLALLGLSVTTPAAARPRAEISGVYPTLPPSIGAWASGAPRWETLDPATYRGVGDIRLGETYVEPSWAAAFEYVTPRASWAIGLAHAGKLADLWGLPLSGNAVLAFAVEESALGCDPANTGIPYLPEVARAGCFNIDEDFDFALLQELFPERFDRGYSATVSGARFESSALTFAYLAAVHDAQLDLGGYGPAEFYDGAIDPDAMLKVTGITHALGADNGHTERIFLTDRSRCLEEPNLAKQPVEEACITNTGTSTYVRSVTDNAYTLGSPTAPYYDGPVTWTDVLTYLDAITPVYPEAATSGVRAQVRAAFDSEADAEGEVEFADGFGNVLDALILALPAPEDVWGAVAGSEGMSGGNPHGEDPHGDDDADDDHDEGHADQDDDQGEDHDDQHDEGHP